MGKEYRMWTALFTYIDSTLNQTGGSHENIEARNQKAWVAFGKLRVIWNSQDYRLKTEIRLFSSIVKSTQFYVRVWMLEIYQGLWKKVESVLFEMTEENKEDLLP